MYRDQLVKVLNSSAEHRRSTFLYIPIVIYKNTQTDLSRSLTAKYIRRYTKILINA